MTHNLIVICSHLSQLTHINVFKQMPALIDAQCLLSYQSDPYLPLPQLLALSIPVSIEATVICPSAYANASITCSCYHHFCFTETLPHFPLSEYLPKLPATVMNCPLLFIQDLLSIQPTHHLPFLLLFVLESCSLTCHVFCFHFYLLCLLLFSLLCMPFSFLLLCDNLPCFLISPFAFFPLCTIM